MFKFEQPQALPQALPQPPTGEGEVEGEALDAVANNEGIPASNGSDDMRLKLAGNTKVIDEVLEFIKSK